MAHGDAREGKWRGNWRMEWVASTLHTTSEHRVSSITTADVHSSAASSRLNWRPADLNGLVRFAERRNLVSARVPPHFKRSLPSSLTQPHPSLLQKQKQLYGNWVCFVIMCNEGTDPALGKSLKELASTAESSWDAQNNEKVRHNASHTASAQKLTHFRIIYIPKGPVQVEFWASRDWVYMWSNIHVCMCVCVYIYIYIYIYTHTHTHT